MRSHKRSYPFVQGEENGLLDVLENGNEETPDAGLMFDSLRVRCDYQLLWPGWRSCHDPGGNR